MAVVGTARAVPLHARTVSERLFLGSQAVRTIDAGRLMALSRPTGFETKLEISNSNKVIDVAPHTLEGLDHLFEVDPAAAADLVTSLGAKLGIDGVSAGAIQA